MTKPTTELIEALEEAGKDCTNLDDDWQPEFLAAATRLRELERENGELRKLLDENIQFVRKPFDPTAKPFISDWLSRVNVALGRAS